MFIQILVSVLLSIWIAGWMVTVGWLGASKVFMSGAVWWRLLQVVLAITIWPILLGAGIHNALLPSDSAEDQN